MPGDKHLNRVNAFLKSYYPKLSGSSRNLEKMYAENCILTWPDSVGNIITQKSNKHLDLFFPAHSIRPKYEVTDSVIQCTPNGYMVLVHGKRDDAKSFVQSLFLRDKATKLLVTNDILVVKDDCIGTQNTEETQLTPVRTTEEGRKTTVSSPKLPVNVSQKVCIITDEELMMDHRADYFCIGRSRRMLKHDSVPDDKPEVPARISSIMRKLEEDNVLQRVTHLAPTLASHADVRRVHSEKHVAFVNELPLKLTSQLSTYKDHYSPDMFCSDGTRVAAFSAAGAVIKACEKVAKNEFGKAFAIVRPPGHHASHNNAEGYCFLNNIAIGAEFLIKHLLFRRVLVVDFDVHHGNGTQKIFYDRKDVLFFSTFCSTINYPTAEEKAIRDLGNGVGSGYNINVPLMRAFEDADLLYAFNELLIPIISEFDPEIILISAGYDAAAGDTVGKCNVTPKCYATLLNMLGKHGTGRLVLALEGGYKLDVLADCTSHSIRSLLGDPDVLLDASEASVPDETTVSTINELKSYLMEYWEVFKEAKKPS